MRRFSLIIVLLLSSIILADAYEPLDTGFLKKKYNNPPKLEDKPVQKMNKSKPNGLPEFNNIIKDFEYIPGLFDLYWSKEKNKFYIALDSMQLDTIYLANLTRKSGDAMYYDAGSMLWEFPFIFQRLANAIQLVHINTSFRADSESAIHRSIKNNFSNSIISVGKIISSPNTETGKFLIDANEMFIKDLTYVSQQRQGAYQFDKKNSSIGDLQSYPMNTEIQINAHFISRKWTGSFTLPDSHSMMHTYHISLSSVPDDNFTPRLSDDRIGYFTTIYQDYTSTLKETPYIRYINKWNLQKKYPNQAISEPIEPIIYWLENTIPEEFRPAVREGVLAWNHAFEKIGFKNAVIVKQMPDDATWHPGDARYNTIRWIVQPGSGYAVGPSRANPFTGELYDADIRISADFTRAFYREFDEFVLPVTADNDNPLALWDDHNHDHNHDNKQCKYAMNLSNQMILSWHALISEGAINGSKKQLKEYVHNGLVDLVLHEVGHTLGLRHNFKASSIFTIDQLSNPEFTKKNGISGSVMDYHPVCLLDNGHTMFQTKPGVYDDWAIEYGYSTCEYYNEKECLDEIAKKSNHPYLAYGTDEDAFGLSSKGIDPLCSTWDMGKNPIAYYNNQLDLVQKLWKNLLNDFEVKGTRFQKIRSVFSQGISEYYSASRTAAKFIGGIHFSRNHIGDPNQKNPLVVVDAKHQREALEFINNRVFSIDAFNFDYDLLNKLSPERNDDFNDYVWRMDRLDYPIHTVIKRIQSTALYSIFHPRRILRIQDNELRVPDENRFTLTELFSSTSQMIWSELDSKDSINSYRRELQKTHINLFRTIGLDLYNKTRFPSDAKNAAKSNLRIILKKIYLALPNSNLDEYTKIHLESMAEDIESIFEAQINIE